MCSTLTIVAYDSTSRMIAQCEHGTLHLTWDITTLRLREQDFMMLVRFLDQHAHAELPSVNDGWCVLECDVHKTRRLWIGQVALVATAADFAVLCSIVAEAAGILQAKRPESRDLLDFPLLTANTAAFAVN